MGELYRGRSQLTGEQIFAVATFRSENAKTGDLAQVWILDARLSPTEAVKRGFDRSICGDCPARGTYCYVNVAQAPQSIYHKWMRRGYQIVHSIRRLFRWKGVRFGAYGDPAALPFSLVEEIVNAARMHVGYSHQWRTCDQRHSRYLMASVESETLRQEAKALGWRTYRVKNASDPVLPGEIVCPASEEGGRRLTCEECGLCSGTSGAKTDVVINAHGTKVGANRPEKFRRYALTLT